MRSPVITTTPTKSFSSKNTLDGHLQVIVNQAPAQGSKTLTGFYFPTFKTIISLLFRIVFGYEFKDYNAWAVLVGQVQVSNHPEHCAQPVFFHGHYLNRDPSAYRSHSNQQVVGNSTTQRVILQIPTMGISVMKVLLE